MMLTPQQRAALENLMKTPDGRVLREVLDCYILELKDEVLDERISPAIGKAAISKLQELTNKLTVLAGEKPPGVDRNKHV